jgi:hypothetical protein
MQLHYELNPHFVCWILSLSSKKNPAHAFHESHCFMGASLYLDPPSSWLYFLNTRTRTTSAASKLTYFRLLKELSLLKLVIPMKPISPTVLFHNHRAPPSIYNHPRASHAHLLLQDRNPLTSVEGSCFPSRLVFLLLVRVLHHRCHALVIENYHVGFLLITSECIINRQWYSLVRTNVA